MKKTHQQITLDHSVIPTRHVSANHLDDMVANMENQEHQRLDKLGKDRLEIIQTANGVMGFAMTFASMVEMAPERVKDKDIHFLKSELSTLENKINTLMDYLG